MAQSSFCNLLAGLTLLFCIGPGRLHVAAQNSGALSKRPPVIRIFDPDRNETTTFALLFMLQGDDLRAMAGFDPDRPPPEIRLYSAEYIYPGQVGSRPQVMAFVFAPRDKYKSAPNFSVMADGTELHRGETTLREMCCVEVNGRSANPQHIVAAVPVEIFERVRQAKKVELKLTAKSRKFSFKLNDNQKKSLDALADTFR